MDNQLPDFKYHPDPIKTGVIEQEKTLCPVCNQEREYVYTGPFYNHQKAKGICPWCIKDGSAAKKYDGDFQDIAGCEDVEKQEYIDELIHRTPGYRAFQQERWPSHCGDFCAFIGCVGWDEIKDIQDDSLKEEIESIKQNWGQTQEEFESSLKYRGSHQGYLFKCIHCGKYRLLDDND